MAIRMSVEQAAALGVFDKEPIRKGVRAVSSGGGGRKVKRSPGDPTPEGMLTKSVKELLKTMGIFHWKQFQGLGTSRLGISDIVGIRPVLVEDLVAAGVKRVGIFFAVELKAPGKGLSLKQAEFLGEVRRAGGLGFVADDLDKVIRGLNLHGGRHDQCGG